MLKKDVAGTFLQMAWSGAVPEAYEKYIHPDFIHHNAYFQGDRETLLQGMHESARQFPNMQGEILRALEDGDMVAVHSKVALDAENVYSVVHIFRFAQDKIIEEWELAQEVTRDSPNENGVF